MKPFLGLMCYIFSLFASMRNLWESLFPDRLSLIFPDLSNNQLPTIGINLNLLLRKKYKLLVLPAFKEKSPKCYNAQFACFFLQSRTVPISRPSKPWDRRTRRSRKTRMMLQPNCLSCKITSRPKRLTSRSKCWKPIGLLCTDIERRYESSSGHYS